MLYFNFLKFICNFSIFLMFFAAKHFVYGSFDGREFIALFTAHKPRFQNFRGTCATFNTHFFLLHNNPYLTTRHPEHSRGI